MNTLGDLRRRQEHVRLLAIGLRTAAEVSDLGEHQAFVVVHGVGNRAVRRDDGVVVIGDLLPRGGRRRGVNARGTAEDRERAAAARLGLVVPPQPLAGPAALGHGLGVARGVDPIFERETPDLDRREQRPKLGGHRLSSRKTRSQLGAATLPPVGASGGLGDLLLDQVLASSRGPPLYRTRGRGNSSRRWHFTTTKHRHAERVTETARPPFEELLRVPQTRGVTTSTKIPWWPQRDSNPCLVTVTFLPAVPLGSRPSTPKKPEATKTRRAKFRETFLCRSHRMRLFDTQTMGKAVILPV